MLSCSSRLMILGACLLVEKLLPLRAKYCYNPCSSSQFLFPNSTCNATCPLPLLSRSEPDVKYCYNPCNSSQLLFPNSSCFSTCPLPLLNRSEPDVNYCYNPCFSSEFLFANSSCNATCPLPLLNRSEPDVKYCYNPCSATEQFLYTDSTCMNNCQSPLAFRYEPSVQYCFNPCENITDYLFTNGSCLPTCPIPLAYREDPGVKYCYNPCPNPAHQYLYLNGTCLPTCLDPLSKRFDPGVQFCENPCPNKTDYLYANKSCYADCISPLIKKADADVQYCINPCSTDTIFLHMNGSCLVNCVSPLIERSEPGTKYCFTPCNSTQFLFTNETCVDSCPSPLASKTESAIVYCYNPCRTKSDFLYTNGSCYETCPYPLANRSEPGVEFCYTPCPSGEFLYENGTCSAKCDSPLVKQIESIAKYCINPCETDVLFLHMNGSCLEDCPYPLVNRSEPGTLYCWNPCPDPSTDFLFSDQSCLDSCPLPLAQKNESGVNYCFNPCPADLHLYLNQSCFDSCPAPLVNRSASDVLYCENPCPADEHLYANGTCSTKCNLPLVIKTEPDVMYCVNPCSSDTLFLYSNLSCFKDCPSPLVIKSEPGANYCMNPCEDPTVEFLYTNSSCNETCPYPLANRSEPAVKYCFNPCSAGKYLYPNQTCSTKCPSPLVSRKESDVDYCFNPCPDPLADYLYTNGSCLSTCPSPLYVRAESGVKYCYSPCPNDKKYLYPNGSCIANCPTPLLNRTEPGAFYCYLPCAEPNIYWYANGSCMPNCTSPYQQITYSEAKQCLTPCRDLSYFYYEYEKGCFSTCQSPYTSAKVEEIKVCYSNLNLDRDTIEKLKKDAETIAEQGAITSGGMKAASALSSGNPSSALLAGLSSMLQYIRYMKINYPPKVETLFLVSADTPMSISFDFDIPEGIDAKMGDYPLPNNFDKYDINSNFVRNMWDLIGSFLAGVLAIFGLMIVVKLVRRWPKIRGIFKKLLAIAKWNVPAAMLCSSSGDIFFYASLHINVLNLNDWPSKICFGILLGMVGLTIWLWCITIQIALSFRKVKGSPEESEWKEKWQDYELLFAESEEDSYLTIAYMAFFVVRGFIFNLTIGCLYEFPLVQVAIINTSNFLMFGYLIICRPLKDLLNLVQVFVNEAMIIILSLSILILAIMDQLNIKGTDTRYTIGEAILFIIKAFNTMGLVFMGIQLLMMVIFAYKAFKYFRAKGIKSPLKMLQILAFEDFESDAGLADANNPLARIMRAGKKKRIRKPPRKEKNTLATDIHNTSSSNLIINLPARAPNPKKGILKKRNPSELVVTQMKSQTTEIESSDTQSRLEELSFDTSPMNSLQKDLKGEATFTFRSDHSEIMSQHHPASEEEIRDALNKRLRRTNPSSPLKRLISEDTHEDKSLELDKSATSESEATFRFDKSEVMSQHHHPTTEEEIREALNKSKRKLRLRAKSSSPSRRLNSGNSHEEKSLELDKSGMSENQNEMMEITLFGGEMNETSTISLFSDSHNPRRLDKDKSIFDSLRKLKERRNRVKIKEEPEGTNKSWLNKMRKLKDYLRNKKE